MFPELYHAHHSLHLEDLPFWRALASQTGDPILELGCGTGRVLIPLAQAGYKCFGVDRDPGMLQFLRTHIDQRFTRNPYLVNADISLYSLAEQFALVILPCNTFSTLNMSERQACLWCVRKHLRPGGIFAFSVPNPELLEHLPAISRSELEDEFFHPITGNPVQVSSSWRRRKNTFVVIWNYDQLFPDGTVARWTMDINHQRISVHDYLDEIRAASLQVQNVYGDFDRSGYTSESPNLIILATN